MANEIRYSASIKVVNGALSEGMESGNLRANQAALGGPTPGYVTIGTSEETVAFGELGTKGFMMMKNLDATNFVEWGFSTGVYGGKMLPGETAGPFRLNATSLYIKADTAACKCLIKAFEA